ncbi:hypothetical protein [Lewinella sp. 4G2]|uniref:hypothetical protein n=1 Tax=Lewinella sp. 4G2 TaxID=1803372 RepID=UPI0007B4BA1E|nr:hypothetical protein [Lewinella sp. 4G2]OAV42991.1 hypothetical protein A3850_000070 [Lewinella sp. 4G2]
MKKLLLICLFAALATPTLMAQQTNLWKTLSKITYEKKFDDLLGFKVDVPVFSEGIKELDGEMVEVSGYIVPVEGYKSHSEFVFSAYPYNMCFFCGGAGPETVMEVTSLEPVKYTTDKVRLRGKLALNNEDINRLMYVLTDAKLVKDGDAGSR